jgi:hypothetical protein
VSARRCRGQVDEVLLRVRPAVVNRHLDRRVDFEVGHPHLNPERQRAVAKCASVCLLGGRRGLTRGEEPYAFGHLPLRLEACGTRSQTWINMQAVVFLNAEGFSSVLVTGLYTYPELPPQGSALHD